MEQALVKLTKLLNDEILPFSIEDNKSYEPLLEKIGDNRIVLMGEATHGTHEFYKTRIELSKLLIRKKNFNAIAIEGDWPSVYPMHAYIQGDNKIKDAVSSLNEFKRFPIWMWRNNLIPPFLTWLKEYNSELEDKEKIGIYGLDLYSLHASIIAVISYLKKYAPKLAEKAIARYACFDEINDDPQKYGFLLETNLKKPCIKEVTEQVIEMQHMAFDKFKEEDLFGKDLLFYTLQNARLIKNAEHYYRAIFQSRENTWNIRDTHMGETLQNLITHLETKLNLPPKIIIWAHNSHIGDARATDMSARGEINLGQIVREQFSNTSFHLGFSTYDGTVTAANNWDSKEEIKKIVPAIPSSYEAIFHELKFKDFILLLHDGEYVTHLLNPSRLQRAIGVVYRPDTELQSHYYFAHLPYQFDALIHFDRTNALKPLE